MTLVPRPADMATRLTASRSGSRWAGVSPTAWAARNWGAHDVDYRAGVLDEGRDPPAPDSVSERGQVGRVDDGEGAPFSSSAGSASVRMGRDDVAPGSPGRLTRWPP